MATLRPEYIKLCKHGAYSTAITKLTQNSSIRSIYHCIVSAFSSFFSAPSPHRDMTAQYMPNTCKNVIFISQSIKS